MKARSKALAILSCRFSVERHLLILDPAAVGIHLLRIIKPASSLSARHIAAVERETWKKKRRRGWLSAPRWRAAFLVQLSTAGSEGVLKGVDNTRYFPYTN